MSVSLRVRPVSVYVQNTTFCQCAGGGIKSHSVTALVITGVPVWVGQEALKNIYLHLLFCTIAPNFLLKKITKGKKCMALSICMQSFDSYESDSRRRPTCRFEAWPVSISYFEIESLAMFLTLYQTTNFQTGQN